MYPQRHAARFGAYAFALAAITTRSRLLRVAAIVGGVVYASTPVRRAWRRFGGAPPKRFASLLAVPAAMGFIDAAKMSGYVAGRLDRSGREDSGRASVS
jgi:hypothetical protein